MPPAVVSGDHLPALVTTREIHDDGGSAHPNRGVWEAVGERSTDPVEARGGVERTRALERDEEVDVTVVTHAGAVAKRAGLEGPEDLQWRQCCVDRSSVL